MKVSGGTRAPQTISAGSQVAPVPSGAGGAKLTIDQNGVSGTPGGTSGASGASVPVATPAAAPADSTAPGLALPAFGGNADTQPQPKRSNKIDPNNPEDLKSFSNQ
jgi:hypothetical protein